MIKSKEELLVYLRYDSKNYSRAIGLKGLYIHLGAIPTNDQYYIWKYIKILRFYEYHLNKFTIFHRIVARYYLLKLRKLSYKTGFQIPPNVLGKGVTIWHFGNIIINEHSNIGENCVLNPGVIIGWKCPQSGAPQIGNNVFIGGGSSIIGDITIGDNVIIAPNSAVTKSFPSDCIIGGCPAKIIKKK